MRENERLKIEIINYQQNKCTNFSYNSLKNNDKHTKYLTGFADYCTLEIIFDTVKDSLPIMKCGKMNKFDIFLMTLIKIRLDLPFAYLSLKYEISTRTISNKLHKCVIVLHAKVGPFVFWPDKEATRLNRPAAFQIFGDRAPFIIDCFEVFSEKAGMCQHKSIVHRQYI